jgi:type IV pilus assembly protein PilO
MTNLQEAANAQQLRWRQRLLLGLPVALGGLVAAALTSLYTIPQWLGLQANSARFQQLEALRQQLPLLRDQLAKSGQEIERSESQQVKLLRLIEGSGEFSTFLAQLDLEASRNGLQLELFEPTGVAGASAALPEAPAAGSRARPNAAAEPPPPVQAPLQAAGLEAERVLLSARGPYPSLLAFMRSVEKLSLLVVPSDFALQLVEISSANAGSSASADAPKSRIPELKLALTFYKTPAGGLKPPPAGDQNPQDANKTPATN